MTYSINEILTKHLEVHDPAQSLLKCRALVGTLRIQSLMVMDSNRISVLQETQN